MRKGNHGRLFIVLITILALGIGCAGMKPSPRYGERSGKRSSKPQPRISTAHKIPFQPMVGDALDKEIERWWGTPYEWGGETCRVGTDCSGYVQKVMQNVYHVSLPRVSAEQYLSGSPIQPSKLRRGDLVFFSSSRGKVDHVGIYLGKGLFTHSSQSEGVTIDPLDQSYYRRHFYGAKRVVQ